MGYRLTSPFRGMQARCSLARDNLTQCANGARPTRHVFGGHSAIPKTRAVDRVEVCFRCLWVWFLASWKASLGRIEELLAKKTWDSSGLGTC
jgi:hypothetical protein